MKMFGQVDVCATCPLDKVKFFKFRALVVIILKERLAGRPNPKPNPSLGMTSTIQSHSAAFTDYIL